MEAFRIICETCHSRLKIRSPDVIGEIHACPKCGSMVHVLPPAGLRTDAGTTSADRSVLADDSTLAVSTTASLIIPADFAVDLPTPARAPELPVAEAAEPVQVAAQATSKLALWAVGGAAAILVGGLGLAWAIWPAHGDREAKESPAAVAAVKTDPAQPQPTAAATNPPDHRLKPSASDSQPADHPKDSAVPTLPPSTKPATSPPVADAKPDVAKASIDTVHVAPPAEARAALPKTAAVAESAPAQPIDASSKPIEPAESAPDHAPVLKFDPLDFDPNRLSIGSHATENSKTSTSSIPDQTPSESVGDPEAAKMASAGGAQTDDKTPIARDMLPPVAAQRSITVSRGQPADGARPQKPGQRWTTRVNAFQVTDMPLAQFVDTLGNLAGQGITLDPVAMELVGTSARAGVTVNAVDATLGKILSDGVSQQRLSAVERGDQMRVQLSKPDERRAIDCDVKDLVAGPDAAAIGHLIERFVAPATWQSAGGAGTIQVNGTTPHVEQSDAVRRQVVVFCERLRLARRLPLRSKYPPALLSADSPYEKLAAKLSGHTTFTFLAWTRLAEVVHQWQEMSGLTILVDWGALAEAELGPASPVACSAIDRSWAESLDAILEPLGLGWWAVDGETIQITTIAALEKLQRIEFYTLPAKLKSQFATSQALIDSLQKKLGERLGKEGKSAPATIELDGPSGRLLVLASPAVHRYLSQQLSATTK